MLVDRVLAHNPDIENYGSTIQPLKIWYGDVEALVKAILGASEESDAPYRTGEGIWKALARTLVVDREDTIFDYARDRIQHHSNASDAEKTRSYDAFPLWRNKVLSSSSVSKIKAAGQDNEQPPLHILTLENIEYEQMVRTFSKNRCFFITKNKFIGLGPKGMQTGDVIAVLAGSTTPSIFRPLREEFRMVGEGGDSLLQMDTVFAMPSGERKPYGLRKEPEAYRLIGEYYVHGLMYNEVWNLGNIYLEELHIV